MKFSQIIFDNFYAIQNGASLIRRASILITVLQQSYSTAVNNFTFCTDSGSSTQSVSKFSFFDDMLSAFDVLSKVAHSYTHKSVNQCNFIFEDFKEGGQRFCYDLAPFMLLDKMSSHSTKPTIVDLRNHNSLRKVLCCLNMTGLVSRCECKNQDHSDVFPVPVMWYEPPNESSTSRSRETKLCQAMINDSAALFSHQIDAFHEAYKLGDNAMNDLVSIEHHLKEILSNCSHARGENGETGEWGFCCYLAKRDNLLSCNLCVITLGRTLLETFTHESSKVTFNAEPFDIDAGSQDLTEPLSILGVINMGPSSIRGFQSGGLHGFFEATQELSSKLDVSVISGNGMVTRHKAKGAAPEDSLYIPKAKTPGTVISVRFEVEL